jgi:natural product biosynthesis luciferase-like monooxygenase protein
MVPSPREIDTLVDGTIESAGPGRPMQFSLLYFSSNAAEFGDHKYRLLLEGAKFADTHGFTAVWLPERHFHPFGGLYPNPSVLASALAMVTERIRLRAGSVVLPMHHPVRVVEEWAVVDNLSRGRVDLALAAGWNPNDFVLAPANYANRYDVLFSGLETIRMLWRGETVTLPGGLGNEVPVRVYPAPQQPELATWITCSGGAERFIQAGERGANVLTALLFQSVEELAEKIAAYRQARAQRGYDPAGGHVTLMLHTFVGDDLEDVRRTVRGPFIAYLESSVDLWQHASKPLADLAPAERDEVLAYAFERYFQTSALLGTPQSCAAFVSQLQAVGVNEIASLIDFGIDPDTTLDGLAALNLVRERCQRAPLTGREVPAAAGAKGDTGVRSAGAKTERASETAQHFAQTAGDQEALPWIALAPPAEDASAHGDSAGQARPG